MNRSLPSDWDAAPLRVSAVAPPYLMGTGVVTGDGSSRPLSPPHSHPDAMLAWCYRGTVRVSLRGAIWRLAPGQGVWVPAHVPHTTAHEGDAVGCYTYIPGAGLLAPLDGIVRVLVPRAVQEMLLHLGTTDMDTGLRVRVQSVLIEMLQQPTPEIAEGWGEVPLPADERVRALVQSVLKDPGDARSARELFAAHGVHERTVLRVFTREVGMSFGRWRTGVRMTHAARLIIDGTPVGTAARHCGYTSASAFSAAFKDRFGSTPMQHVARVNSDSAHRLYWR